MANIEAGSTVASLTALGQFRIGPYDIGKSVYVSDTGVGDQGAWYQAMQEGAGLTKWRRVGADFTTIGNVREYLRTFSFDDVDIDVAATSAAISFGDVLPTGAVVVAVWADVTADWTDGGAGTFSADLGDGSDPDRYTPTALDIDGGIATLGNQVLWDPSGGVQLEITFTGDVNLSTLTGGTMVFRVWFIVPEVVTLTDTGA